MKRFMHRCIPATLHNRLFSAVLLFILFPFSLLNVYIFGEIEALMQEKISEQSHEQLE